MKMQLFFATLFYLTCTINPLFASREGLIFDNIKTASATEDSIDFFKNSIYFQVSQVKNSGNRISTENKISLEKEYEEIRKQINIVYLKMANDVKLLEPNSVAYQRYKPELDLQVKNAYVYMDKVNKLLNRNPAGAGWLEANLLPMMIKIGDKIKGFVFYNKLKWKPWKDIK